MFLEFPEVFYQQMLKNVLEKLTSDVFDTFEKNVMLFEAKTLS